MEGAHYQQNFSYLDTLVMTDCGFAVVHLFCRTKKACTIKISAYLTLYMFSSSSSSSLSP